MAVVSKSGDGLESLVYICVGQGVGACVTTCVCFREGEVGGLSVALHVCDDMVVGTVSSAWTPHRSTECPGGKRRD